MSSRDIITQSERRKRKADILFWLFVIIFSVTVIFSFLALAIIFGWLKGPDPALRATFDKFAWALWSFVIVQVLGGIIALFNDLFGLSIKGDLINSANEYAELIDGLVRSKKISNENANQLRKLLSNMPGGVAGTVLGKQK